MENYLDACIGYILFSYTLSHETCRMVIMKRSISLWQWMGFAVTSLGGTLLHFLYEWTNESLWSAPFSGVNESTWEHMKLLYFPMFIYALIQSRFFRDRKDFWCIKLAGMGIGLSLIPVLFYTLNGAFGKTPDWINIAIFFVSAAAAYFAETKLYQKKRLRCVSPALAFGLLCLIGVLFVIFTFIPPQIPLFQDPLTGTYGIQ